MENLMEIMAYIGSLIIFISFCTKNVSLLRILNNIGCVIFLFYAFYHGRLPLIILNSMVIAVNVYHIWSDKNQKMKR